MSENMMLVVEADRCTGCNTCMLVCSFVHDNVFNYERSRIRVWRDDDQGVFIPITCDQCEDAPCIKVCPTGALYRNDKGLVARDSVRCIGCNQCLNACPIGAITRFQGRWRKCDQCSSLEGIPYCAANCTAGALRFVPASILAREKAERSAKRRLAAAGKGA